MSAMRSGEAAATRLEWVRDGALLYPAVAMKGGEAHRVALSPWAREQIASAMDTAGEFLFRPLGNLSDILGDLRERTGIVEGWRFHDLRRSFRSWAAKRGIGRDAAETCLGHSIHRDDVDRAYQRHAFEAEAERAFHRWQQHIERLVTSGDAEKVVPIRRQ
jgi:integrase